MSAARPLAVLLGSLVLAGAASRPAAADIGIGAGERLRLSGDFRLRAESDRDSTQPDGVEREDRDRLRIRFRFGLSFALDEHVSFGGRIRTGNPQDQQSPHQTLGDEFETKEINVDRAWLKASWKHVWTWGGKNAFPFWTQNELFWDEDVNPEGVAVGGVIPLGGTRQSLKPVAAYFILEDSSSSNEYDDTSRLAAAQIAYEAETDPVDVVIAAGFYQFRDDPATTDVALADQDYDIWVASVRAILKKVPRSLSVGVDCMRNTFDYAPAVFNGDQDTGYVASLLWGSLKERNNWLVGYYHAHIEKFAVVARLAQDDWLRWGSATDTRSSNFEGHELRVAYAFKPLWNVMLRYYDVEGIALETATAAALEDGKRLRLDFNIGF